MAKRAPKPVDDDDDEEGWPPDCSDNPAIKVGDGARWHYLGSGDAVLCAGVLDAEEIPGNPACKRRWWYYGWHGDRAFMASRLGKYIAVTLYAPDAGIIYCRPAMRRERG